MTPPTAPTVGEDDTAVELELGALRELGHSAYRRAGLSAADAETVVEVQLSADLRGVDTHGFQRLPWYVRHLQAGRNNPSPAYRVLRESSVSVVLDADNALGQLACVRLAELTIGRARETGLAVGVSRNSNDWGCGAYYPLMAAEQGLVAFATTTSVPTLAPFGSRTRLLGNNPMVYAVPRRSAPPLVLDMALTPVALGKVMRAQAERQEIPRAWGFLDDERRPTTDPSAALAGVIPAIGGFKGTGLSMMMNVLAGVLPGGWHSAEVSVGRRGQLMMVLSPGLFGDADRFLDEIESMAARVGAAEPLPGVDAVYLPGELESLREAEALARGTVRYPRSVVEELSSMAASLGIAGPTQVRASRS
ncbi:MAG TPA: Ldh family oxidoreductase [Acidimicrobiales bacterium]|nr:Ldh family oxidoreductase [Acidimicrobiales bacterium]